VPSGPDGPLWRDAAGQPSAAIQPVLQPGQPGEPQVRRTYGDPPAGAIAIPDAMQELRSTGNAVSLDSAGVVRTVTAATGKNLGKDTDAFVTRYAAAFGLVKGHTLKHASGTDLPDGGRAERYQQYAGGIPVLGSEIVVTTSHGDVRGAIAGATPLTAVASAAKISAAQAQEKAVASAALLYGNKQEEIQATASLWQYQVTPSADLRPTYWVQLSESDGHDLASILVDALDGTVLLTASAHETAKDRLVCDLNNQKVNTNLRPSYLCTPTSPLGTAPAARSEGEAAGSIADVNKAYDYMGAAYDYFKTNFGRDSFDNHGALMAATVRVCHNSTSAWDCPFQNAFWEGQQLVFGAGWATDDVVAHEFTHGVTEHSSQLLYWGQSGALNEAFSDIFGQYIDLETPGDDAGANRWMIGEDLGSRPDGTTGPIRNMMNPNLYGDPAEMFQQPYWIYNINTDNGGVHTNSGVANRIAAMLYDGDEADGVTALGPQRSAQLFYRTQHVLPSGSNYEQFGHALVASCRELIGTFGLTADHCRSVEQALQVTNIEFPQLFYQYCSDAQPVILFSDDFEPGGTKWTTNDPIHWAFLPNHTDPFTYAASGKGAANGWAVSGAGHNALLETAASFKVPAAGSSFLTINNSTLRGNGLTGINLFVVDGQTVQSLASFGNAVGPYTEGNSGGNIGWELSPWAGKSIKLRFVISDPNGYPFDFFLDDVRAFSCDTAHPGPIRDGYAYVEGGNLKVDWYSVYVPNRPPVTDYHFELSYSPAIPGAPTTFQPTETLPRYGVTAPGADPLQKYTVTVKVKMNSSGMTGPAVTLIADPNVPTVCAYIPYGHFTPYYLAKATEPLPASLCSRGPARVTDPVR
jgi:Zn-dependent metalloprotease